MRLKMIRAELPRVSYCEVQEYAKVEVDFTGCGELNTSELKRRATAHFVRDVVGGCPAWSRLLRSGAGNVTWRRIEGFLNGRSERIYVIVDNRYPYLMSFCIGENLWRFPGKKELVQGFIPDLLSLFPTHEKSERERP